MSDIAEFIEFVNQQSAFHARQAIRYVDDPRRSELHSNTATRFSSLAEFLVELQKSPAARHFDAESRNARLSLTWEEVEGLPDELLEELSISDSDKSDFNIISLINECGGVASLDRLLVAIYQQSGEVMKRLTLNSRLYRMVGKELIFSVPGKKGIYSTVPVDEETAEKLT